jgi:hypothetical protein
MIHVIMITLEKTVANQRLEVPSTEVSIIDAICINCNKRFKSMHAVSMHLKTTARHHSVNFINYGIYDKRTGLKEINRQGFRNIGKAD